MNNHREIIKTTERLSQFVASHRIEIDDTRDLAIDIVDELVSEKLIPDCIDTDDETEFSVQDIIHQKLNELFNL
jgi:hypothetical protein